MARDTTQIGPDGRRYPLGQVPQLTTLDVLGTELRVYGDPHAGDVPVYADDGRTVWQPQAQGGGEVADATGQDFDCSAGSVTLDPSTLTVLTGADVQAALSSADELFATVRADIATLQGRASTPGPPGPPGYSVRSGLGVPPADLGIDGDFYIDTALSRIYGPKTGGGWGTGISLIGPAGDGEPGNDGLSLLHGDGVPPGTLGRDGEYYIADDTHVLYGPKAGGTWPDGVSIIGPKGDPGTGTDAAISPNTKGFVFYGGDANVARPDGYGSVEWLGYTGTEPVNAVDYDSLIQVAAP